MQGYKQRTGNRPSPLRLTEAVTLRLIEYAFIMHPLS